MLIRMEEPDDHAAVRTVNTSAFESVAEANLVDALRKEADPIVSMVAIDDKSIVGHIMFSPVTLSEHPQLNIMGLAPMAIQPSRQRKGVGSALVRAGLNECKQLRCGAVVVLGHPEYYPRFGFVPSRHFEIGCEYQVPEDVFMVLELQPGFLQGARGIIKYHPAFSNV